METQSKYAAYLRTLLFLNFLITLIVPVYSQQAGQVDLSFNPGSGPYLIGASYPWFTSMKVQQDGKILVGGRFQGIENTQMGALARLNSDGSLDTSFAIGQGFNFPAPNTYDAYISSILVQPDGKVIVGGEFQFFQGLATNQLVRLNPDGSRDISFQSGNLYDPTVYALALQADGKILVGGDVFSSSSVRKPIVRYNPDGSIDPSFNIGSGPNFGVDEIAVQPDGKILVSGRFTNYHGTTVNRLARLNADGSLDPAFNSGGSGVASWNDPLIFTFGIQSDGKILIGGRFDSYNGNPCNNWALLNTDGSFYASTGVPTGPDIVHHISVQPDDKFIIGREFETVKRYNANGTLDNAFIQNGVFASGTVYATALQTDGKILLAGKFDHIGQAPFNCVARLHGNGVNAVPDFIVDQVAIFPNPATNKLTIQLKESPNQNQTQIQIKVLDLLGKVWHSETKNSTENINVSVEGLPSGSYFVSVETQNQKLVQKFIKQE